MFTRNLSVSEIFRTATVHTKENDLGRVQILSGQISQLGKVLDIVELHLLKTTE